MIRHLVAFQHELDELRENVHPSFLKTLDEWAQRARDSRAFDDTHLAAVIDFPQKERLPLDACGLCLLPDGVCRCHLADDREAAFRGEVS